MTVIQEKNVITKFISDTSGLEKGAKEATKATNGVEKAATKATKGYKDMAKAASDAAKEQISLGSVFQQTFGAAGTTILNVAKSFRTLIPAITGTSTALKLLRAALISTGIGAIVVVLGSLASALFTAQRGIDALQSVLQPLRAIFQSLVGAAQNFGFAIIDAFKNPQQILINLGNLVRDQVINRFNAFGEIVRGIVDLDWKRFNNGVLQGITGVENVIDKTKNAAGQIGGFFNTAIKGGSEIAKINIQLEKLEATRATRLEAIGDIIEENLLIARDVSKTDAQRKKATDAILKAAQQEADVDLEINALKQKRLKIEQSFNDTKRTGAGSQQELNELVAEQGRLEDAVRDKRLSLLRVLSGIAKRAQVEELLGLSKLKKALEDATKELEKLDTGTEAFKRQAEEVKRLTGEVKQWEKAIEDALSRTESVVEAIPSGVRGQIDGAIKAAESAIKGLESNLLTAIVTGNAEDEKKIRDQIEFIKNQLLRLKSEIGDQSAIDELLGKSAEAFKTKLPDKISLKTDPNNEAEVIKFEEHVDRLKSAVGELLDGLNQVYATQAQQAEEAISVQEKRVERYIKLAETGSARQLIIEEERLQRLEEMRERSLNQQRKIAQAQLLINTAQTISNSIAAIAKAFETGGPAGIALGIATAAALALTIAGTVASAKSSVASIPAFAEGTEYFQGKGTGTSDSNIARISKGERIVSHKVNTDIYKVAGKFPNAKLPEAVSAYMNMPVIYTALNGLNGTMESGLSDIKKELIGLREENRKLRINFLASREGLSAMISQYEMDRAWMRS